MKWQVLQVGSGFILFEGTKEECEQWQKEHKEIDTFLWKKLEMRVCI